MYLEKQKSGAKGNHIYKGGGSRRVDKLLQEKRNVILI